MINLSKVAVGCSNLDALRQRQRLRLREGVVPIYTRFRPKRADELVGGSLYWIVRHRIVARQKILGFDQSQEGIKTIIRLHPSLVLVEPRSKRAHQGWRYLTSADSPPDVASGHEGMDILPPELVGELRALALL